MVKTSVVRCYGEPKTTVNHPILDIKILNNVKVI